MAKPVAIPHKGTSAPDHFTTDSSLATSGRNCRLNIFLEYDAILAAWHSTSFVILEATLWWGLLSHNFIWNSVNLRNYRIYHHSKWISIEFIRAGCLQHGFTEGYLRIANPCCRQPSLSRNS